MQPVVMTNEGQLASITLGVEEVPLSQKRFRNPPVSVESIDSDGVVFSVDDDSLVEPLLIAEPSVEPECFILVFSLDDLNSVSVDLLHSGDGVLSKVVGVVEEAPLGCLGPAAFFQVVLRDHVLEVLESKSSVHF